MSKRVQIFIVLLASVFCSGCISAFSSKTIIHESSTHAELGSGSSFETNGWDGQVVVNNIGPGEVTVSTMSSNGQVLTTERVVSSGRLIVSVEHHQRIRVLNHSNQATEIQYEHLDR